jgi:chromosome segregation ATPase
MSDKLTAADALRKWQKQCDPEGIEVQVSRQALDEVLDALEAKDAEIERLETDAENLRNTITSTHLSLKERDAEIKRLTAENAEYLRNGSKMLDEIERLEGLLDMKQDAIDAAMQILAALEVDNDD